MPLWWGRYSGIWGTVEGRGRDLKLKMKDEEVTGSKVPLWQDIMSPWRHRYSGMRAAVAGQTPHNVVNKPLNDFIWHFQLLDLRNDPQAISTHFSPFLRLKMNYRCHEIITELYDLDDVLEIVIVVCEWDRLPRSGIIMGSVATFRHKYGIGLPRSSKLTV
uniref:Uncharacterized protein n=1 Tax=Solanum tuberosum TaxID=4113 RepID=M1D910_SOLTU